MMSWTKPSSILLAGLVLAASPLSAEGPNDYLGLRTRIEPCPQDAAIEATVFLPRLDGVSGTASPDCTGGGRLDLLWAQLPERPAPGDSVRIVVAALGQEGGAPVPMVGSHQGTTPDLRGQAGGIDIDRVELLQIPRPHVQSDPFGSVRVSWGALPVAYLMGWNVYRLSASQVEGDPTASDFLEAGRKVFVQEPRSAPLPFTDRVGAGTWYYAVQPVLLGHPGVEGDSCAPDATCFCPRIEGRPIVGPASEPVRTGGTQELRRRLREVDPDRLRRLR